MIKPTWIQRIKLSLFGHAYVEHRRMPGWSGALPFYMFKCPEHGLVENYPSGYAGNLRCPICVKERHRK